MKKPRIDWRRTGMLGILIAGILFSSRMIYISVFIPPSPTPLPISLADAKVEFQITIGENTQNVSTYGTLDLQAGDRISIETIVMDANSVPYPHALAFKYFFASGRSFSGKVAPYTAKDSGLIPVEIKDQITGETITRTLRINVD